MGVTTRAVELSLDGLHDIVARALAEDLGRDPTSDDLVRGDVTTQASVSSDARCRAEILLKEPGVVCGLPVVEATCRALDQGVQFEPLVREGDRLESPDAVARVEGSARAILAAERTCLNFLGRLSGVATLTRAFVDAVEGTGAVVLDTRKTTPGLRALEKYATRTGGARNHRSGLYDAVLLKDNHLRLAGGVKAAVGAVRRATTLPVEVEVESLEDVLMALEAGADLFLLDNMSLETLAQAVALAGGRARLEASGGVSLSNVTAVARTGVDYISVGALTHSSRWLDVSLEVL
jgi:nicotinate-nucleotide pyrophosphorylase (carboxylating)